MGVGEVSRGHKWGRKETVLGDGCTMQGADDVLLSHTLDTCIVL